MGKAKTRVVWPFNCHAKSMSAFSWSFLHKSSMALSCIAQPPPGSFSTSTAGLEPAPSTFTSLPEWFRQHTPIWSYHAKYFQQSVLVTCSSAFNKISMILYWFHNRFRWWNSVSNTWNFRCIIISASRIQGYNIKRNHKMSSSWALESKSLITVASNVDKALPNTSLLSLLDSDSQMEYKREVDSQMGFF